MSAPFNVRTKRYPALDPTTLARALAHQFKYLIGKSTTAPKEYAALLANIDKVRTAGNELVIETHVNGMVRITIECVPPTDDNFIIGG